MFSFLLTPSNVTGQPLLTTGLRIRWTKNEMEPIITRALLRPHCICNHPDIEIANTLLFLVHDM